MFLVSRFWFLVAALALAALPAGAQEPPEQAEERVTAIVGGEVWPASGPVIPNGVVLVRGTKIEAVGGPDTEIPAGAEIVDASGKVVAPGFVTAAPASGLASGGGRLRDSVNPFAFNVTLGVATGLTTAYVQTGGGGGGGQQQEGQQQQAEANPLSSNNAILKLAEGDLAALVLREQALPTFNAGSGMLARHNLRDRLTQAREYEARREEYERARAAGEEAEEPRRPSGSDAALQLVRRERTLRVTAASVSEIRWALALVDDFGLKLALTPATEAWLIPEEIARRQATVLLNPRTRPRDDNRRNTPSGGDWNTPGILQRAGVPVAVMPPGGGFATGGMLGRDLLTYQLEAAWAMRGGLDAQGALEAITLVPARILGIEERVGSLEPGKDADLLLLTGDPLDYRTLVDVTFVNGRRVYDRATNTLFRHWQGGGSMKK